MAESGGYGFPLFMGLPFAYASKALLESMLELLFDQELAAC